MDLSKVRFVCDCTENEEMKKVYEDLREFQQRRQSQAEFLKKQVDDMQAEHKMRWTAVFETAQRLGKIPEAYSYDDYSMTLGGPGNTQLFLAPDTSNELPDFIKRFLK